jgi:predicted nucleotidyltransferase
MTERTARREIEKAKSVLDRAVESEHRARERFEKALTKAAGYGLSQREIASAAGVSQPYVSQVLRRRPRRFVPSSPRGDRLVSRRAQVIEVLEGNGLREPAVFGSVARGEDGPDSDIDLLVTIPSDMGLLQLARVEVAVEDVLGCPVDLVPRRLLAAGVRSTVERDEVPL